MSQPVVALIDSDAGLSGVLAAELPRYGMAVETPADANELMARKQGLPQLVVLCIDPKRTGWAMCNKIRKSGMLKNVPLVVTSSEATEHDFDDHRKLKTRADAYLHKPFTTELLVQTIGGLIALSRATEDVEIPLHPHEISINEQGLLREEEPGAAEV